MNPSSHNPAVIALVPRLEGLGGPVSFNKKLMAGLAARGIRVTHDLEDPAVRVALINGGTRHLDGLLRARRRGVRLVQRLDGMNWIQRRRWLGLRHSLRAEGNNLLLALIRRRLADAVVYQSEFSRHWWEQVRGPLSKPETVVYNGVDLAAYSPHGAGRPPADRIRLLMVEGHLGGGNDLALDNAVGLAAALAPLLSLPLELRVVGDVPERFRQRWAAPAGFSIEWSGVVARDQIPEIDRSAHLFFSAELHAPCPNSVIEALACGLPVAAYDTGSLTELVQAGAGVVAPYGADPWAPQPARPDALARAAAGLLGRLAEARVAARARAESAFSLDQMVTGYLEALIG